MIRIFAHSDDFLGERIFAHSDAEAPIFVQLVQQDFIPKLELFYPLNICRQSFLPPGRKSRLNFASISSFVRIRSLFGVQTCWTTSNPVGPPHSNAFGYPNVQGNKCAKSECLKIGHPLEALTAAPDCTYCISMRGHQCLASCRVTN